MTPAHAQPVVIRLPDATEVSARVDAADDSEIRLVLAVPDVTVAAHAPAVVEYRTPTGIHRIAGALERHPGEPGVLHLHRDGEETVQRREWARVDALLPCDVRFEDPGAGLAATVTLNLSGGGALIRDPVGLALGTAVLLELHLDGAPIRAHGGIVRETADGAKGVQIDQITSGDRERIVRFVLARQRSEMRLRRGR